MTFQEYSESTSSKFHLGTVNPRLLIGAVVIAIAVIGFVSFAIFGGGGSDSGFVIEKGSSAATSVAESSGAAASSSGASAASAAVERKEILVHVGGCVASPGVVRVGEGARVADAIAMAGGMTEAAARDAVNLARVVADGEQVIVPSAEQVSSGTVPAGASPASSGGGHAASSAGSGVAKGGKININTATSAELQTISGIGESKAAKIIDYREKNGPFKSVDDLTNVSGIGEKTLDSMRESICV